MENVIFNNTKTYSYDNGLGKNHTYRYVYENKQDTFECINKEVRHYSKENINGNIIGHANNKKDFASIVYSNLKMNNMKKLVILDFEIGTVLIFTIDHIAYRDENFDFNIESAIEKLNEKYDLHLKESNIQWMLTSEDLTVSIF